MLSLLVLFSSFLAFWESLALLENRPGRLAIPSNRGAPWLPAASAHLLVPMVISCFFFVFFFCFFLFPLASSAEPPASPEPLEPLEPIEPISSSSTSPFSPDFPLSCNICHVLVDEMQLSIALSSSHPVQSRFRIDEKRRIPYSRSEYRLLEILEDELEGKFSSYGLYKPTGELPRLIRQPAFPSGFSSSDGKFAGFRQSKRLSKRILEAFREFRENFLDEITAAFSKEEEKENIKQKLCVRQTSVCLEGISPSALAEPPAFVPKEKEEKEENQKEL